MGVRPIPGLGAEAEFIDFGTVHMGAGPIQTFPPYSYTAQFLGGEASAQGAAVFAVGYLPLPLPFMEPFAKLGWGWVRERDSYSGNYGNAFTPDGPVGLASGSNSNTRNGLAYGEKYSPSLLSVGLNWTF